MAQAVRKDVDLSFHGSINLLQPLSTEAEDWMDQNIPEDARWFGSALATESRYTPDIIAGMIDDGLAVYIGKGLVTSVT